MLLVNFFFAVFLTFAKGQLRFHNNKYLELLVAVTVQFKMAN